MDNELKDAISSDVDKPIKYVCDCNVEVEINKKNNEKWAKELGEGEIPENYPTEWIAGFCLTCGTPIREI